MHSALPRLKWGQFPPRAHHTPPKLAAQIDQTFSLLTPTHTGCPDMAASTQDVLEGIERRRVQLQENVNKLQAALTHWTTWEAEYATLREEIQRATEPSVAQMRDIARDLQGSLLTEKEFEELLGKNLESKRSANQVIDIISRRIDYVQQNSGTVEKQLDAAEKQLAGVDVLLEPGLDNEEGLPMMDIEETLDDAGNEISSSVNQTGKGAAEVVEVLRKAGLHKVEMEKKDTVRAKENVPTPQAKSTEPLDEARTEKTSPDASESRAPSSTVPTKSVSFTETDSKAKISDAKEALLQNGYDEDLETFNFNSGTKVIQLDENDEMVASYPVIPQGESQEDAELRRQMLQYGLSEVGRVVAELDLDHPTASYSDDDMEEDSDFNDCGTDDDEEEDEYGRTTKPVVTEDYRRQMMELEQKLGARMLENVGPGPDQEPLAEHVSDVRTMRVRKDDEFDRALDSAPEKTAQVAAEGSKQKKGVRFADRLDVSEAPLETSRPPTRVVKAGSAAPTMSDTIVERCAPAAEVTKQTTTPVKVSRFKSARAGPSQVRSMLPQPAVVATPPVPTGPAGRTLAHTITEHTESLESPQAPDPFDPVLIHRQVQAEYHKARNRMIQQQGGFKATDDDDEDEASPIAEGRDGQGKKVSRFMAARLKAAGV